jgi:hypothetical protein
VGQRSADLGSEGDRRVDTYKVEGEICALAVGDVADGVGDGVVGGDGVIGT